MAGEQKKHTTHHWRRVPISRAVRFHPVTPGDYLSPEKHKSMDWFKGKSAGNHGFLPSNIGLSCKFSHHPILWTEHQNSIILWCWNWYAGDWNWRLRDPQFACQMLKASYWCSIWLFNIAMENPNHKWRFVRWENHLYHLLRLGPWIPWRTVSHNPYAPCRAYIYMVTLGAYWW